MQAYTEDIKMKNTATEETTRLHWNSGETDFAYRSNLSKRGQEIRYLISTCRRWWRTTSLTVQQFLSIFIRSQNSATLDKQV